MSLHSKSIFGEATRWVASFCLLGLLVSGAASQLINKGHPALEIPEDFQPWHHSNLQLVESWPVGTRLDHHDIDDAADVWPGLSGAARTIDLAQFYVSDDPAGPSRLTRVLEAIREAAGRGVKVRFLAEERFYKTYPTWLDSLSRIPGIEVRRLDSAAFNGGVLHAKYFIVDGVTSYIGSQNFDWRSLEHIQELGVTVRDSVFTAGLRNVFEYDWTLAGLVPPGTYAAGAAAGVADSLLETRRVPPDDAWRIDIPTGEVHPDTLRYRLVASPMSRIPNKASWELVPILKMIEEARDSVSVQLLTYKTTDRSGEKWPALDDALRLAAGRGVRVRLLVSNWCKRKGTVECLQDLSTVPNVEVRFMNIPEWSGGFIPFARTVHAKYMAVDGRRFWIGTSNWEKDYFFSSRNVGVAGESLEMGRRLSGFFRTGWDSEYAEPVRAGVAYTPPRVSE